MAFTVLAAASSDQSLSPEVHKVFAPDDPASTKCRRSATEQMRVGVNTLACQTGSLMTLGVGITLGIRSVKISRYARNLTVADGNVSTERSMPRETRGGQSVFS